MSTSTSSRNKSNGPYLQTFCRPPLSSSASSTSSSFSSCSSSTFFARATSPTRVSLYGHVHGHFNNRDHHRSSSSVRFSLDNRPISPNRSISFTRQIVTKKGNAEAFNTPKRTCACSPTTHPGSFRCALHRRTNNYQSHKTTSSSSSYHSSGRLNYRRSAMTNSLVRIGGVEGELVKRSLSALIRPSSHHQRRRAAFEPRPSRFYFMSKAENSENL
ncbi:uncharacterized protein LOC123210492 [Mangifera indica]|uniref:uncharacterized protein LOC123210492 n=1 Tax=Mangifera indica TaxID=29780 RepID=UPI001CF9B7E0|nr:uncharacterized protein LOC123210492 [Mangifera indica]